MAGGGQEGAVPVACLEGLQVEVLGLLQEAGPVLGPDWLDRLPDLRVGVAPVSEMGPSKNKSP